MIAQEPDATRGTDGAERTDGMDRRIGRRSFLGTASTAALCAGIAVEAGACLRALVPNVLYEKPRRAKVGAPESFADGTTYLEDQNVFLLKEGMTFQAISAVCTHLGCTVKLVRLAEPKTVEAGGKKLEERQEFHCPCHGSRYRGNGVNYEGPAPRPLDRFRVSRAPDDGQLVIDLGTKAGVEDRFTV